VLLSIYSTCLVDSVADIIQKLWGVLLFYNQLYTIIKYIEQFLPKINFLLITNIILEKIKQYYHSLIISR